MAGVQWTGNKCKGGTEAKAKLMHDDKEQRLLHEHDNPDIDIRKTPFNFSYRGLSYGQKCRRYDAQVASAKVKRQSSGKNANTTMMGLCVYLPKGLQEEDRYDPQRVKAWFKDVGDILKARYGDDFIEMDVHVDEVHPYQNAETGEWEWSRVHGHAAIIPTVMEDGERYLNGKKFASRAAINSLNQEIHKMSMQKYHVPYMDGSGKKGRATVTQLKARSAELLLETEKKQEQTALEQKKTGREQDLVAREQAKEKKKLDETAQEQANTQKKQDDRTKVQKIILRVINDTIKTFGGSVPESFSYSRYMAAFKSAKDNFIETTKTEAEKAAEQRVTAEWQAKLAELDAQSEILRETIHTAQELQEQIQADADADSSRKHFMESKRSGGRTLEEYYQDDLRKRQADMMARTQKLAELAKASDAGKDTEWTSPTE